MTPRRDERGRFLRADVPPAAYLILEDIRSGLSREASCRRHGIRRDYVERWRANKPEYRDALDEAARRAVVMRAREQKMALLWWMETGRSAKSWFRGPGCKLGFTSGVLRGWKRDPWFLDEYTRRARRRGVYGVLLAELEQGSTLTAACQRAGCGRSTIKRWRACRPELWALVEEAREKGRAKRGV